MTHINPDHPVRGKLAAEEAEEVHDHQRDRRAEVPPAAEPR
jgi:hypothetical protein